MFLNKKRLKLNNLTSLKAQARQIQNSKFCKLWMVKSWEIFLFHDSCLRHELRHISPKLFQGCSMSKSDLHDCFTQLFLDLIKSFIIVVVIALDTTHSLTKSITHVLNTTFALRPRLKANLINMIHEINVLFQFDILDSARIEELINKATCASSPIIMSFNL